MPSGPLTVVIDLLYPTGSHASRQRAASAEQVAAELAAVQRRRAMDAAYEAQLILRLAAARPTAADPAAPAPAVPAGPVRAGTMRSASSSPQSSPRCSTWAAAPPRIGWVGR